jgi:hypothetical protein
VNFSISTLFASLIRRTRNSAAMAVLAVAAVSFLPSLLSKTAMVYAQNTNATIRGQVLDPTGALVPDAHVVIVNKNTGVTVFSGESDSAGFT